MVFVDLWTQDPTPLLMLVQKPAAPRDWTAARNIAQVIQSVVVATAALAAFVWRLYVFRVGRNNAGQVQHVRIDLTKVIDTSVGKGDCTIH